jgi:hypothetical protein
MTVYSLVTVPFFDSLHAQIAAEVRPLSQLSDEEYDEIVANACAGSPRGAWIAFGAGVAVQLGLFGVQRTYQPLELYVLISFLFMFGTMGWIVYAAIASTRLSRVLSRQPLNVDILDITPFEPIGRHSLLLSMAFVGGTTVSLFFVFTREDILHWRNVFIYGFLILVTVSVFFLNMWSTHRLLSKCKKRHVENAAQIIAGAYHELTALTEQNKNTTTMETKINAWTALEKRLKVTRTWPYNTEMLRTLVITALTPIVVGISKIVGAVITSGRFW